jgi:transposase
MVLPPNDDGRKKSRHTRRREMEKRRSSKVTAKRSAGLPLGNVPPALEKLDKVNLNAAGIDVGANVHYVAVPEGRDPETSVRCFRGFTSDLEAIADWLEACGVATVAMESTGVYWIPLYELLQRRGFEVLLAEASQVKKIRRKTDVLDCQWIQTLHMFGLLSGSFRPDDRILELRGFMRQRDMLMKCTSDHIRHMQKALQQMNVKLTEVVSDITGLTGMSIIKAILAGERDPEKLAKLRHENCKNDEATIALALHGNWRIEHLFALKQAVELFEYYQQQLGKLDKQVEAHLQSYQDISSGEKLPPRSKCRRDNREPSFDMRNLLYRMTGVDLTTIDGIGGHSALQIISEIGTDMSAWETEKHFVSWLCLCPEVNLSGGSRKSRKSRTQASRNRVATCLRVSAQTLLNSKCALGAFGRRLRSKKGPAQAITAMARKLAIIVYNMLKHGRPYRDRGADYYEEQYRQRVIKNIRRRAEELGFELTPAT